MKREMIMKGFEITLKFEERTNYPVLTWQQMNMPHETEILVIVYSYAIKYQIPLSYIEKNTIAFIEELESSLFDEPDVMEINFSKLDSKDQSNHSIPVMYSTWGNNSKPFISLAI